MTKQQFDDFARYMIAYKKVWIDEADLPSMDLLGNLFMTSLMRACERNGVPLSCIIIDAYNDDNHSFTRITFQSF